MSNSELNVQGRNTVSATENESGSTRNGGPRSGYRIKRVYRWVRLDPRGDQEGVEPMQGSNGDPHLDVRASNSGASDAPVHTAVPGSPLHGAPAHAVRVEPSLQGQQLHGDARDPPMFPGNCPVFVNPASGAGLPEGAPAHAVRVEPSLQGQQLHGDARDPPMFPGNYPAFVNPTSGPGLPERGAPAHAVRVEPSLQGQQLHGDARDPPMFPGNYPAFVNPTSGPGLPERGAPAHAVRVEPSLQGQQLHGDARDPPMFPGNYPAFVNPTSWPGLPERSTEVVGGAPHSEVGVPSVNADYQERDIIGWVEAVRVKLFETYELFLLLYNAYRPGSILPLLEHGVIPPHVFELVETGGDQEGMIEEFRIQIIELYARILFLFEANMNRSRQVS